MGAYWEGVLAMGGLGLIAEMLHNSATQIDNGSYGRERIFSTIGGPTVGTAQDILKVVKVVTLLSQTMVEVMLKKELLYVLY